MPTINTDDYSPTLLAVSLLCDHSSDVQEAIANRTSYHADIADAVLNGRDDQWITEALDSTAVNESGSLEDAARVLVASGNRDAYRGMCDEVSGDSASDIMSTMAYWAVRQDITEAINGMSDDEVCEAAGIAVCDHCDVATCDVPTDYHYAMRNCNTEAAGAMLPDGWRLDRFDDPVCPACAEHMNEDD